MLIDCDECEGQGEVIDPLDAFGDLVLCPSCGGTKVAAPGKKAIHTKPVAGNHCAPGVPCFPFGCDGPLSCHCQCHALPDCPCVTCVDLGRQVDVPDDGQRDDPWVAS